MPEISSINLLLSWELLKITQIQMVDGMIGHGTLFKLLVTCLLF